jgi:hypothetical protein
VLQFGLAGWTGFFALTAGVATSSSFTPLSPMWGLAGPAAVVQVLAAMLLTRRDRWALVLTTALTIYGVLLGLTTGAYGIPLILGHLVVAGIVWSMPEVFPEGSLLPTSRRRKVVIAAVAVAAIVVAMPMLFADPLKPSDTREPAWAGVIASTADRELTDGRRFGRPEAILQTGLGDGYLIVGGGSVEAPTWVTTFAPFEGDPSCFMTSGVGRDEGPTVVIVLRISDDSRIGLRVRKAPGFQADPATDGRYVGHVPPTRHVRLAAAGGPTGREGDRSWSLARAGHFCLDSTGQVTKWDRGE